MSFTIDSRAFWFHNTLLNTTACSFTMHSYYYNQFQYYSIIAGYFTTLKYSSGDEAQLHPVSYRGDRGVQTLSKSYQLPLFVENDVSNYTTKHSTETYRE